MEQRTDPTMNRAYDDIPRQGVHHDEPLDTEPTTNVRAHDPVYPVERSKETRTVHVLLKHDSGSRYRLQKLPKDGAPNAEDGFEEIDRVPEGGDVDRLYDGIPDDARDAVFEHTHDGTLFYESGRRPSGDWTDAHTFDQVTLFRKADDAVAFADERRENASGD